MSDETKNLQLCLEVKGRDELFEIRYTLFQALKSIEQDDTVKRDLLFRIIDQVDLAEIRLINGANPDGTLP